MRRMISLVAMACALFATQALAEIQVSTGVIKNESIPAPTRSHGLVVLNVPHMSQKPWHCGPTSAAMILAYFGRPHDPDDLKRRAEDYKPEAKRNKQFTYWNDILH